MNTFIDFFILKKDLLDNLNHSFIATTETLWWPEDTILYRIQKEETTSTCPNCGAPLTGNNICEYCKTRFYQ